jgi:hypothetical protein
MYNRIPSQAYCSYMFKYQETTAFQSPRTLLRILTGKFHPGENGIHIESFEIIIGSARRDCDGPDLLGRNKGIIDCFESLVAFIRTFINGDLPNLFAPVQEILLASEFLHRANTKILLVMPWCITTSVKTVAHDQFISIKGIGLFGQELVEVSHAIVVVLSSRTKLKAMEDDFSSRQAEDELCLKVINKFDGMGDLTEASPVKKRGAEDRSEEDKNIKKLREKEKKKNRQKEKRGIKEVKVSTSGVKIKAEPGVKSVVGSPIVKRENPCMYHLANKLNLKDSSNTLHKCPRGVTDCLCRHLALNKIQRDKPVRAATSCPDLILKALLLIGVAGSTDFLKKIGGDGSQSSSQSSSLAPRGGPSTELRCTMSRVELEVRRELKHR